MIRCAGYDKGYMYIYVYKWDNIRKYNNILGTKCLNYVLFFCSLNY